VILVFEVVNGEEGKLLDMFSVDGWIANEIYFNLYGSRNYQKIIFEFLFCVR
jgi:hypothetical protein